MLRTLLLAGAAGLALGATASAATLVGLTADNHLVRFDSETRRAMPAVKVSGPTIEPVAPRVSVSGPAPART